MELDNHDLSKARLRRRPGRARSTLPAQAVRHQAASGAAYASQHAAVGLVISMRGGTWPRPLSVRRFRHSVRIRSGLASWPRRAGPAGSVSLTMDCPSRSGVVRRGAAHQRKYRAQSQAARGKLRALASHIGSLASREGGRDLDSEDGEGPSAEEIRPALTKGAVAMDKIFNNKARPHKPDRSFHST